MKGKKALSTVLATALVVAQMAMPVMAAETGTVDVEVTTQSAILRVVLPTKISVAIDQFEIGQTGAQVNSSEFDIENKSQMAVKVEVTSAATLASGVSAVDTKAAAVASTAAAGEVWLATAAKTAADSYAPASTTKEWYELGDADANVTTFVEDNSTIAAKQTFYLEKASGDEKYALLIPADDGKVGDVTYAKFYALTAKTVTNDDDLQTLVNAGDVYSAADDAVSGATVTLIAKGTASVTIAANTTYYTAATDATAAGSVVKDALYVYAAMETTGAAGKAGFRYIGKLGDAKESWTNADISAIAINYSICGITGTNYDGIKDDCVYGFYADPSSKAIACKLQTIVSGTGADITTAITTDKGVYVKVKDSYLTADASKLTSVKLNDTALTITTKGNSSGNGNAVYFKLPAGTTLKANDVITLVVDEKTYTFTVAS